MDKFQERAPIPSNGLFAGIKGNIYPLCSLYKLLPEAMFVADDDPEVVYTPKEVNLDIIQDTTGLYTSSNTIWVVFFRSKFSFLSRTTKLILYKTLILPVLLYGAEAWTLLSTDAAALRVFERKLLRKIFGPVRVGDDFRIRFKSELYELLNDMDVVHRNNIQRLRWLGDVVRMEKDAPARRVFDAGICASRRRGRPCIPWKDQIEEALSSIGVTNWRRRNTLIGLLWPIK